MAIADGHESCFARRNVWRPFSLPARLFSKVPSSLSLLAVRVRGGGLAMMRHSRVGKRIGIALCVGFALLNLVAYQHARAFTHFGPPGPPIRPDRFSLGQKVRGLLTGIKVPRPENRRTPANVGLVYERIVLTGGRGVELEAWLVPHIQPRGTVVLFHGHAASKDSQLREAKAFHQIGFNALLVDFYGSGGSGGNETSIGFFEALDVTKAFEFTRKLPQGGPVVLYGASMGAAAVLKAVADDKLEPEALILECPFDNLLSTVRHRFTSWGLPPFPLADLLVFWGGVQEGFNALQFRPVDSAARIDRPTLLITGARDPWVRPGEAQAIFDGLGGAKVLKVFADAGHDSYLHAGAAEWRSAVANFLDKTLGASAPETSVQARDVLALTRGRPRPSLGPDLGNPRPWPG